MAPAVTNTNNSQYLTIIGGELKEKCEEGDEGATLREYELKDGTKGSKWEKSYSGWQGKITGIEFDDTKFGKVLRIIFDDVKIQISKQSRYYASLLERLPAVDLTKEIIMTPYDFEADGKKRTGVSITQDGEKIKGFFFDGTNSLHGIPDGKGVDFKDEDECKMFFMQRDKFLMQYTEENVIPKIPASQKTIETDFGVVSVDEDNIPLVGDDELGVDKETISDVPF